MGRYFLDTTKQAQLEAVVVVRSTTEQAVESPSRLFVIARTAAHQAPLSSTVFPSLLRLMFPESVMLSHSLLPLSLAFSLSQHQGLFQ